MLVEPNPSLPTAVLFEWIAAVTISFSVGFAKLGAMCFILDVQRRTHENGRRTMFVFIGVNVRIRDNSCVDAMAN